jgi:hypothetical protein
MNELFCSIRDKSYYYIHRHCTFASPQQLPRTKNPLINKGHLEPHRIVRLSRNLVAKIAALRGEIRVNTQILDSSQQELKLSVSRCRGVLRDLDYSIS